MPRYDREAKREYDRQWYRMNRDSHIAKVRKNKTNPRMVTQRRRAPSQLLTKSELATWEDRQRYALACVRRYVPFRVWNLIKEELRQEAALVACTNAKEIDISRAIQRAAYALNRELVEMPSAPSKARHRRPESGEWEYLGLAFETEEEKRS